MSLLLKRAQNEEEETSPIEFYRITHTNKEGIMSEEAADAYVRITYNSLLVFVVNMQTKILNLTFL